MTRFTMPEFIAPYILLSEAVCHHCGKLAPGMKRRDDGEWPMIFQSIFTRFASLREGWGGPIGISSFYRCPDHEQEVSGSRLGPHIFGLAADLEIGVSDQTAFMCLIDNTCPELRVGRNRKEGQVHLHIDTAFYINPVYSLALIPNARWEE